MDMAQTFRRYETESGLPDGRRPALEVVRDTSSDLADGAPPAEARSWHSAALGAVLGLVATTTAITVIGSLAGMDVGGAFGLGAFVGAFSGVGFGFMMGGVASLAREFDAHPADVLVHDQRD
jgi:xanthine/uracil/vitamin C permease (AzgA family)